jgi:aspartyl/asparaginyl beta-hydroxylase (cupin superfamily)
LNDRPQSLTAQADEAVAAGDMARAIVLLGEAAQAHPDDLPLMLKLAAVNRAAGQPQSALDAVHRALAIAPLDFMALLMRATLLERLDDGAADEAWSHALAQRPSGELPPQLAAVVARGEQRQQAWLAAREQRMKQAAARAVERANEDERARVDRFRNNVLRRTRPYHSEPTHFHFPGLRPLEFHPRSLFPWLETLESATEVLAAELEAVMAAERAELVPYIQYEMHQPLDQWRPLNHNPDWTAIHLLQNGKRVEANARHCPEAMALMERLPQPRIAGASPNAMFSLLAPGTAIPPHVGVNNARLVCHLPLIVPQGCWFRVGAETRQWERGKAFVFDDTIEHEASNPSDELRIVFIFDIWHPDLSEVEREAVAAMIGAEGAAGGL